MLISRGWTRENCGRTHPGIVELGLDSDVIAFFFVLCSENLELGGLERAVESQRWMHVT